MRQCRFQAFPIFVLLLGPALAQVDIRHLDPSLNTGTSGAVVVSDIPLAYTALILPLDTRGRIVGPNDSARQVEQVLENLSKVLEVAGTKVEKMARLHVYVRRSGVVSEVEQQLAQRLSGQPGPAVTYVEGVLAHPEALVAMDAIAAVLDRPGLSEVERILAPGVPSRPGTSHVAILPAGRKVFVAGRAARGSLEEAVPGTLEQLRSDLEEVGLSHSRVVQLKVFLNAMDRVEEVERMIGDYYRGETPPAVSYVEWFESSLPVEIEAVAAGGPPRPPAERVEYFTPNARFSRMARVNHGGLIFVSGLYGRADADGERQIHDILTELRAVLEKTGSDLRHLVKATYYPADQDADQKLNDIRPEYYDPQRSPSASKIRVRGVGRQGMSITLDMIAVPQI